MARQSMVALVAAELRRQIVEGEFGNGGLRTERVLSAELGCNRSTLQLALATLRAEGLVYSVPGIGWFPNRIEEHATFELIQHRFNFHEASRWPALMRELLDYRRLLYVAIADAMVRRGLKVSRLADFWAAQLRFMPKNSQHPHEVLRLEESFFLALAESLDNLALTLALRAVSRIFEQFRHRFAMPFLLPPLAAQLDALTEAIDAGILALALVRAHEVGTSRDELHLALANGLDPPGQLRSA